MAVPQRVYNALGAWGAREVLGKSNLDGVLDGSVEIDSDLTVEAQSR